MLRITRLDFGPVEDRSCPNTRRPDTDGRSPAALAAERTLSYRGTGMSPPTPVSVPPPASFDSVVLAAVVAECQSLVGARVQRVYPLGPDGLVLALRAAGGLRSLLISAHPKWGRICLGSRAAITPQAVRGGPTPFMQLTKSRLEGSTLRSISTPPFERLVTCTFETLEGAQDLIVEIMGRHSNLILCVGGVIVGALKHVSLDRARAREVLPQRPYIAPAQPRPDPVRIAAADLAAAAAVPDEPAGPGDPTGRPAWRTVLETVGGIGPALAWEACLRAKIDPRSPLRPPGPDQVADALHTIGEIVLGRQFSPVLYRDADGAPAAYGAFPLIAYATLHQEPTSMSSAVEAVTERVAGTARLEGVRQGLATTVTQAAARTNRALAAVAEDARGAEKAGHLREQGELILAYLPRVEPGASMLEAPGFDGEPTRITLDPRRSGVENAQAYFKRYARAAAARKRLPERLGVLEADRGFLEGAANAITQAETEDDLWEVEQDLI
ncbi:MAG: Rqc2 family fibronectin-binding protein, partial [Armatimonadota bacterium]